MKTTHHVTFGGSEHVMDLVLEHGRVDATTDWPSVTCPVCLGMRPRTQKLHVETCRITSSDAPACDCPEIPVAGW